MAFLSPTSIGAVQPGYVVVNVGFDTWLPWAQGSSLSGALIGITLTPAVPGGTFQVQAFGLVPYNVFKLSGGTASSIVAGQTPSRGTTGQLIGTVDISGNISLPGTVVGGSPGGGGGGGGGSISGTGLAHVTASILDGFAHLGAVATSPVSSGSDYIDSGVEVVINVKTFGAKGDGATDDTTAINNAISAALTTSNSSICKPTLFFPMGVYIVSSTIFIDNGGPSSNTNYLKIRGQDGGNPFFTATTIRWNGASQGVMFELSNVKNIRVHDISFDGNGLASICVWTRAFSTGLRWTNVAYLNTIAIPPWQPGAHYSTGQFVVVPTKTFNSFGDNSHVYKCTTAGTSGASAPAFTLVAGGATSDNSVVWTEFGPSPTCLAYGDLTGAFTGSQTDESFWSHCFFQGRGFEVHSSGTAPPGVSFSGVSVSVANVIGIIIKSTGGVGVGTFQWVLNGVAQTTQTITSTFALPNTGLTVNFPAGTYTNDNLYVYCQTMAGGWRALSGSNVKDFGFEACQFGSCGVGLDSNGNGAISADNCSFGGNQCDLRVGGTTTVMNAMTSEGSGYMLFCDLGTTAQTYCTLNACTWAGASPLNAANSSFSSPGYGTGDAFIQYGGCLALTGSTFNDASNNLPLIVSSGASSVNGVASVVSRNNLFVYTTGYAGELFLPIFDSSLNCYIPGTINFYPGYNAGGATTRISSDCDQFEPTAGGSNVSLPRFDGQDLRLGRQMLSAQNQISTATGVTYISLGSVVGACAKMTIPFSAVQKAALTNTLNLVQPWSKTKIKAVYVDCTTAFSGGSIASCTVSVGKTVPASAGTATNNAYIAASDVHSAAAVYGLTSSDLGPDLAATVQGGAIPLWTTTDGAPTAAKQWVLTATFTSTGANLSSLTAGSLDLYVIFETLPGYAPFHS